MKKLTDKEKDRLIDDLLSLLYSLPSCLGDYAGKSTMKLVARFEEDEEMYNDLMQED